MSVMGDDPGWYIPFSGNLYYSRSGKPNYFPEGKISGDAKIFETTYNDTKVSSANILQ